MIMDKALLQKLANRIKELRKLHKYTQDDLADLAQIARSTFKFLVSFKEASI